MDDSCSRCGHDWHGLSCQHTEIEHGLMLRAVRCACESSLALAS